VVTALERVKIEKDVGIKVKANHTKCFILEIYDKMAEAMRTNKPYQTHLDPPPGPPADDQGNFLPLPEWKPGHPKPTNWPSHIHPPREENTMAKATKIADA
jgi:hypothetical protein